MRSLFARLALAGLVGIALAGCGTSNGTTLLSGSIPNNSGGGVINTTNGVGGAPLGVIAPLMIDNGNAAVAYVGFNAVTVDAANIVQAFPDPPSAAVPLVPPSPSGPSPSQATDTGSHAVTVTGNGLTQIIMKYSGAVPNLVYNFGAPSNAGTFNLSQIIAHFSFGTKANGSVTIGGTGKAGDTVTIWLNIGSGFVNVGYNPATGDTPATIAAALAAAINASAAVGPTVATGVSAWVNPANSANVLMAAAATGVAGNTITYFTTIQGVGATETATAPGPVATAFTGGTAAAAPTAFAGATGWGIELVGNGAAAGPGSPAATYDVRATCTATAVGNSLNRFVCPLPAYGAPSNLAPTSGNPGVAAYNVPVNAVFPGAAGAFTPINPTMYVVLTSTSATTAGAASNPWIDYIYAAQ